MTEEHRRMGAQGTPKNSSKEQPLWFGSLTKQFNKPHNFLPCHPSPRITSLSRTHTTRALKWSRNDHAYKQPCQKRRGEGGFLTGTSSQIQCTTQPWRGTGYRGWEGAGHSLSRSWPHEAAWGTMQAAPCASSTLV